MEGDAKTVSWETTGIQGMEDGEERGEQVEEIH